MDNYNRTDPVPQKSAEMIFDLVDVVEEPRLPDSGERTEPHSTRANAEIFELTDVVEETPSQDLMQQDMNDLITKKVSEAVERIARELFPEIAERVIREEIEKLKNDDGIL